MSDAYDMVSAMQKLLLECQPPQDYLVVFPTDKAVRLLKEHEAMEERIRELEAVLRAMERMATHCDQGQYIDYPDARTIFEEARELLEQPR